jgi:hypothetical protein
MATKEQIKATILAVAGNPETGFVVELADEWATAIAKLDEKSSDEGKATSTNEPRSANETRVTKASETR